MQSEEAIDAAMDALEQLEGHETIRVIANTVLGWVLREHDDTEHLLWELGLGPQPHHCRPAPPADAGDVPPCDSP